MIRSIRTTSARLHMHSDVSTSEPCSFGLQNEAGSGQSERLCTVHVPNSIAHSIRRLAPSRAAYMHAHKDVHAGFIMVLDCTQATDPWGAQSDDWLQKYSNSAITLHRDLHTGPTGLIKT
jgi:hypothetical protein